MEDQFFATVLQNVPNNWDNRTYNNKVYDTIKLDEYGETRQEYFEIKNYFNQEGNSSYAIVKIERIQHPFSFGAFLLRKEQLESRGQHVTIKRKLTPIYNSVNLSELITYNMDHRRISSSYGEIQCYVVVKYLTNVDEERDSNSYPEYVIYVQRS